MSKRRLEQRTNNAYDTLLLLEDEIVIGAWDLADPLVRASWDAPGDPSFWSATSLEERQIDPNCWGSLVSIRGAAADCHNKQQ